MKSCNDIRREFIEFFRQRDHTFVPSSGLLLAEDPTLLFANAGMNQFKAIFLGAEMRDYVRAANSQKCIRAGGKHNDLEDVGHDCYHQTFFEMLGNWSFGDYFKAETIEWAWELLTKVWGLRKERLFATVFGGDETEGLDADDEADRLWREKTDIDPSHIFRFDKKDNFWEMGATGPCGPCSEIHIDLTDDGSGAKLVNAGDPRVIEIWNLVFIQFNRDEAGELSPLPARHVDTGMGFERICMVLQGKKSNYATDLFIPIIEKLETLTAHRYGASSGLEDRFDVLGEDDMGDVACRVAADHARALTFAIADGVMPSNEGRGYVLRRLLRRAARYGRQHLQIDGPFLAELAPTVIDLMADSFPKIGQRKSHILETIAGEEAAFARTLDRGMSMFESVSLMVMNYAMGDDRIPFKDPEEEAVYARAGKNVLPGEAVFKLLATYGFPVDLTQLMAKEKGLEVDIERYDELMREHQDVSRTGGGFKAAEQLDLPATNDSAKYTHRPVEANVLGWVADGQFVTDGELAAGDEAAAVLAATNFYGEQGGQVGDTGALTWKGGRFEVTDVQMAGAAVLHVGKVVKGKLSAGQTVSCQVHENVRRATMRNHTATHLLNWALREVLGEHVNQAGSVVAPDRLRFDLTHTRAVTADQQIEVERLVNEWIVADESVRDQMLPLGEALKLDGIRAMFGEKYPDPVRVIRIGRGRKLEGLKHPLELCGGTHVGRTGQIGFFKIVAEESVAKGTRRITALTGQAALEYVQKLEATAASAAKALRIKAEQLPERIEAMLKEIKTLRKGGPKAPAGGALEVVAELDCPAGKVLVARTGDPDAAALRTICDVQRQKGAAAVFVGGTDGTKVTLVAMVSDDLVKAGKLKAGDWVKAVAPVVGGGGGGKPTLAQAGGKQPDKLPEALAAAGRWASERLG